MIQLSIHQAASVKYQVSVIENGRTIRQSPVIRNLLLDSGLDLVASNNWANMFLYAVVGTSSNPTKRDSGTITFTRSGTTVTASASFFEAGDVGRLLKLDTGEEMYITFVTDPQNVEVSIAGTLAASEGTVWYVNDTGLGAESKRTNTYGTDSGDNGTTFSAGILAMKRTFIFSAETASVTYREIGWSYTATTGGNLLGRDVFASAIGLVAGQQLKVVVTVSFAFSPLAAMAVGNVGNNGLDTSGNIAIESVSTGGQSISVVKNDGTTNHFTKAPLEPSAPADIALRSADFTLAQGSPTAIAYTPSTTKAASAQPYTAGSFTRTFSVTFATTEGNGNVYGITYGANFWAGLTNKFSSVQSKDSSNKWTVTFRLTWGRVLTN